MNYVLTENAVGKIRRAITPSAGNTGAVGANGRPIDPDMFPAPWTVRWSASANSGAGAWVIWLPNPARLVCIGDSYMSAPGNIVAETALPTGWWRMTTVGATATAVYLNVTTYTSTGQVFLDISATAGQPATGFTVIPLLVATMTTSAQTGAKAVKQFIDSAIVIGGTGGGGGGGVTLDGISTNWNTGNQVQIKDWELGTPASATTIAQDINAGTNATTLVERDTGGALNYKKCGTLAQLLGSSVTFSNKTILTGWNWNAATHKIEISTAIISAANGVITSWTDQPVQTIDTTPISSILT
jgi:hypothetical protein